MFFEDFLTTFECYQPLLCPKLVQWTLKMKFLVWCLSGIGAWFLLLIHRRDW